MMTPPSAPTGTSSFIQWSQRILANIKSCKIIENPSDYTVEHTTRGTLLHLKGGGGSSVPSTPGTVYHFSKMFGNYYLTTEGVRVAKPYNLRTSVLKELGTDGTIWTFTYAPIGTAGGIQYINRKKYTSSFGGYTEYQAIAPIYQAVSSANGVVASEIYAVQNSVNMPAIVTEAADTTIAVGTIVTWLEVSPARAWTKKVDQTPVF